ncbi:hypothetical protein BFG51_06665 [Dietzia alimentaria]|nr:hypothetical protein BFG51_06665 [Dietzia alimentaria]
MNSIVLDGNSSTLPTCPPSQRNTARRGGSNSTVRMLNSPCTGSTTRETSPSVVISCSVHSPSLMNHPGSETMPHTVCASASMRMLRTISSGTSSVVVSGPVPAIRFSLIGLPSLAVRSAR